MSEWSSGSTLDRKPAQAHAAFCNIVQFVMALWRDAVHGLVPEGAALTAERSRSSRRSARWIAPGAPDPGRRWPRL